MDIEKILSEMTFEEKARMLTGGTVDMATNELERLGISYRQMADGPHGVRKQLKDNCTHFPNLCLLAST